MDFRLIDEVAERHNKLFRMGVYIDNELLLDALHQTKKKAEQSAAEKAIQVLNININDHVNFVICMYLR